MSAQPASQNIPPQHGDGTQMPRHVAIIMDGNGRWAKSRGLPRKLGHVKGVDAARAAVQFAKLNKIDYLTLFAFSSENWRRPADEVQELMGLLRHFIAKDLLELHKQNVRVKIIGARDKNITPDLAKMFDDAEAKTKDNTALTLCIAFNYGARDEMRRAVLKLHEKLQSGEILPENLSEDDIANALDTSGIPDPDVIIRTSGEQRISNFLLWQAAYSEFVYLDIHWPEFNAEAFSQALTQYAGRSRRFGGRE